MQYDQPACGFVNKGYIDHRVTAVNGGVDVPDALSCQQKCASNPSCHLFTYYRSSRGCWLQGAGLTIQEIPGVVSGPNRCAIEHQVPDWAIGAFSLLSVGLCVSWIFLLVSCCCCGGKKKSKKSRGVKIESSEDSDSSSSGGPAPTNAAQAPYQGNNPYQRAAAPLVVGPTNMTRTTYSAAPVYRWT